MAINVPLEKALESEEFKNSEYRMPIIIGYDEQNNLLIDDLSRTPHILVGGMSGSGKSIFLQNIITCLTSSFTSNEMKLALFDLKRVEFEFAKGIPHLFDKVVTERDVAIRTLEKLVDTMHERREAINSLGIIGSLSRRGTNGLEKYNAKTGKNLPKIAVIIDEYSELVMADERVKELVYDLALRGHGAGIHLIIASQRASDEILPSELRAIISTRAVFRVASKEDSWTMLADFGAEDLPGYFGEMLYSSIWMGGKPIKVKVPYISEKKMLSLVER